MDGNFITLVQNLPAELFNIILTLVVEPELPIPNPDETSPQPITWAFKYPKALHLNQHHRRTIGKQIFNNARFELESVEIFLKFVPAMDPAFLKEIQRFQVADDWDATSTKQEDLQKLAEAGVEVAGFTWYYLRDPATEKKCFVAKVRGGTWNMRGAREHRRT